MDHDAEAKRPEPKRRRMTLTIRMGRRRGLPFDFICVGPAIDLYGQLATGNLTQLLEMYPDRVAQDDLCRENSRTGDIWYRNTSSPVATPTELVPQKASTTSIVPSPSLCLLPNTATLICVSFLCVL